MFSHDFISTAQPEIFFSKSAKCSAFQFYYQWELLGLKENVYKLLFPSV